MNKYEITSMTIDALLYGIAVGAITSTMLVAPNAVQILEKPLEKIFDNLDDRQKKRELSRLKSYMKTQGLVRGDYDHGIILTKKAKRRIEKYEFDKLAINAPKSWDHCWRILIFDIPEYKRDGRVLLTKKLNELGFQLLQQSVWIHPFESREVVSAVTEKYALTKWVTYLETRYIDNEAKLIKRFDGVLKSCV